jgi:hypothetical protein
MLREAFESVFSSHMPKLTNHRKRRQFVKLLDERCRFLHVLFR